MRISYPRVQVQWKGYTRSLVTLELFILSTDSLVSLAAISIFSMVSWMECFEPSLVFCFSLSFRHEKLKAEYERASRNHHKANWELGFDKPLLRKGQTGQGHPTLQSVGKHWWNAMAWFYLSRQWFPAFVFRIILVITIDNFFATSNDSNSKKKKLLIPYSCTFIKCGINIIQIYEIFVTGPCGRLIINLKPLIFKNLCHCYSL